MKQELINEFEAMNVICNIQIMQYIVYGKQQAYKDFKGKSIEELRELQDNMIVIYNKFITKKNKNEREN